MTLKLLVVEDDEVDRMAIRRALRKVGLAVEIQETSDEPGALAALRQQPFDCALLDYHLGKGGDGLSVLKQARAAGVKVPIIVMTGQGDETIAVEIMKAGASDYLAKHALSPDRLSQCIRHAVRVRAAQREAERATESLRLLAEANTLLATALDYGATVTSIAALAVPAFAEFCVVDMLDEHDSYRRAHSRHADPLLSPLVERLITSYRGHETLDISVPRVLRTGEPDLQPYISDEHWQMIATDPVHLELLQALDVRSVISVPLTTRGQMMGALSFVRSAQRPPFDEMDLELAKELAQSAAIALDNALLYQAMGDAVRSRDAFITIASHELKTPLTTLAGYTALLKRRAEREGRADDATLRAIRLIDDQAQRLNKMIESLLDFSRLETGQLSISPAPLDLVALLRRLTEEMRPTLSRHTLQFEAPTTPLRINGDELRLEQVFQNLLHNAIKYSPRGGKIQLAVVPQGGTVQVKIQDEGIGIPAEAIPHIFDRFYRAPAAEHQQISGIGVGLFVVHEIVSLHGGDVQLTSEVGQGSIFQITLPLLEAV